MQCHFLGVERPAEATSPSFPASLFGSPMGQPSNGWGQCLDLAIPGSPMSRMTRTVRPVQNFFLHRFCGVVNMQCGDVNKTSADALTKTTAHVEEMSIDGQIGNCEVSTNSTFDTVRIFVTPIFLRCQIKCISDVTTSRLPFYFSKAQ